MMRIFLISGDQCGDTGRDQRGVSGVRDRGHPAREWHGPGFAGPAADVRDHRLRGLIHFPGHIQVVGKKLMGVQIISEPSRMTASDGLIETVKRQAQVAGIGMPEVGVFEFAGSECVCDRNESE